MKRKTTPPIDQLVGFVARGRAAQAAVDRAIAAAAPAPSSVAATVAADDQTFGAWRRCLGGAGADCQAWARGDRGCPRHRKRGSVSSR